jgi:hypothetical protein
MITGYNTDVRHSEVVFHVQTEDKGEANPFIESLVYVGGQVLAARRAGYADLLTAGEGEAAVVAMMERQHRTMIAAIRQGRFDGKLAELRVSVPPPGAPPLAPTAKAARTATLGAPQPAFTRAAAPAAAPAGAAPAAYHPQDDRDRTLDQVILEYLSAEAEQEQLLLTLDGESHVALGRLASLELRATSSRTGGPVPSADVTVRMISTVTEPRNLARGRTDPHGRLRLEFDIPILGRGTAALIISASSPLGAAEIKQLL